MLGIVMRTEKHPPGTAVQSADHSVRRRDRTKIPTQLRASMKQRTEPVFDAASAHYNLDMPSRFGALSYTQEKRVDVGRGHQANESSVVKKVAIIQRIRNNVVQRCGTGEGGLDPNEFFIEDWTGYPDAPKPEGPFRILEGSEYDKARKLANKENAQIHRENPDLEGKQIHEWHPIKFGGSPTDRDNKTALEPKEHVKFTSFWNNILKKIKEGK